MRGLDWVSGNWDLFKITRRLPRVGLPGRGVTVFSSKRGSTIEQKKKRREERQIKEERASCQIKKKSVRKLKKKKKKERKNLKVVKCEDFFCVF